MSEIFDTTGFEGVWEMDPNKSKRWDSEAGKWVPEPWVSNTITMQHFGNVMAYWHKNEAAPGIFSYMGYQCAYNQADWVPYILDRVEGDLSTPEGQKTWVAANGFRAGKPVGMIKHIYIDRRTHYRLSSGMDGVMNYSALRRLSDDGQAWVSHVYDPEGRPMMQKHLIKVSNAV